MRVYVEITTPSSRTLYEKEVDKYHVEAGQLALIDLHQLLTGRGFTVTTSKGGEEE